MPQFNQIQGDEAASEDSGNTDEEASNEAPANTVTEGPRKMPDKKQSIIWVMSNRVDDRVVLFEQDDRHPGGEAFIAGGTPDNVYRTPKIDRLLRDGLLVEVEEPPANGADGKPNRKKPVPLDDVPPLTVPDMPGQPIRLGRELDPELVPESARADVLAQQEEAGTEIASTATVPPPPEPEKEKSGRR